MLFGAPKWHPRAYRPRGCCGPTGAAPCGPHGGGACCVRGDACGSRQVAYARTYAGKSGVYRRRGVLSVGTAWDFRGSRRRDALPTRHETDFSVLEFAAFPEDAEYSAFVATSNFARADAPASEAPTSLRALLPEFDFPDASAAPRARQLRASTR